MIAWKMTGTVSIPTEDSEFGKKRRAEIVGEISDFYLAGVKLSKRLPDFEDVIAVEVSSTRDIDEVISLRSYNLDRFINERATQLVEYYCTSTEENFERYHDCVIISISVTDCEIFGGVCFSDRSGKIEGTTTHLRTKNEWQPDAEPKEGAK